MRDTNSNKPHKWIHSFDLDMTEGFYCNPYEKNCNEVCIREYKATMDSAIKRLQTISLINQSVKLNEDGTIPEYSIDDVYNYYCGEDNLIKNKNIQDLFKINILDLDIPDYKRRTDIPKGVERK